VKSGDRLRDWIDESETRSVAARVLSVLVREQATRRLMRRWGVPSTNRECEETEKRILREASFIYGGEFESKWKKYSGKICSWMVWRTVNKRVEPTQERVFGLWMHRLKKTETLERERKETEREGKQVTDRAPIRPTTQVNQWPIRQWWTKAWKECSNEEERNLFRTEAEPPAHQAPARPHAALRCSVAPYSSYAPGLLTMGVLWGFLQGFRFPLVHRT